MEEFKELTLKFPAKDFESIIKTFAKKTGWEKEIDGKKKQGKVPKIKNPLSREKHVQKVLQDRLISHNK